jgi:hypothetical protein
LEDDPMERKKDLWLRLRNYHFDHLVPPHLADHVRFAFGGPDASTRAFADKLARKLGWRVPFALRAIDEYRKFVYLGLIADFPVTPPKIIDQVWHEHLLFTGGYRAFCASVLRRDFDHHPELVPQDEQTSAFQLQYAATRELYRTEFNREPPEEFWGVPKFADRPKPAAASKPLRRREDGSAVMTDDDAPLFTYFGDSVGGAGHGHANMPEFGGGSSGGGGGSGTWSDPTSHGGHHGGPSDSGGSGHDGGGHGDSGGGSDGGGGDGGSGCSSGCSSGCGSS